MIRCRDFSLIPTERLFGIGEYLYNVKITVEIPPEIPLGGEALNETNPEDDANAQREDPSLGHSGPARGTPTPQSMLHSVVTLPPQASLNIATGKQLWNSAADGRS